MEPRKIMIGNIPALVWGEPSEKVYLCVHGKMSCKESARGLAQIAAEKGCQTLSFDLPQHGERTHEPDHCDVWNGVRDLRLVGDYAFSRWKEVSLYACSLGAYFSLHAYPERTFRNCLFQSPILDMEYLIRQMFLWFSVTPDRLEKEGEIDTPIDPLRWDYYQFVLQNPVRAWNVPTHILYGGRDDLQSWDVVRAFADRFGCRVTVAENSQHPFMEESDFPIVDGWLKENL